jgi:hypothetical protein
VNRRGVAPDRAGVGGAPADVARALATRSPPRRRRRIGSPAVR